MITDWGGVLTNPILETVNAWIEAEGVDRDSYAAVMRPWVTQAYNPDGARNPIHALWLAGENVRRYAAGLGDA